MAKPWAAYKAEKRQRARVAGLCITCCKRKPKSGRTVCKPCADSATQRKNRREATRRHAALRYAVDAHERAGDVAREHHFHAAAAQHYQDALHNADLTPENHDRLSEKLIQALFLSGEPDAANLLYDRLLASYLATPGNGEKAVNIMLKIATQSWLDSKTKEALPICLRAVELAKTIGDRNLQVRANLNMSIQLRILGRYDEADVFLDAVSEEVGGRETSALHAASYCGQALQAALSGNAVESYRYFERALLIVKKINHFYGISQTWNDYAYCATILGDIELAKSCVERALLIARQNQMVWRVPYLCLDYAEILIRMGHHDSARGYLIEALSYDIHVPILEPKFAEIGIPLALYMKDKATLAKCVRSTALTLAFGSGEPETIGSVVTAFAKLYRVQGNDEEAQALLHRAIEVVLPAGQGWDLPLEVARQGARADIPPARNLLESRAGLPCSGVTQACLSLFDAHVAQRGNKLSIAYRYARKAMEQFEALQWYAYADEARSLLPRSENVERAERPQSMPLPDMRSAITAREREVAGFVLQGLTNRAIAAKLSITENTVEKHMTSIMNRLGIRSRHQLADAVEGDGT